MTTAEQILVIFLSTALAIFLVIAIIAGIQAVRLLRTLENIATKAENLATSAEAVGDMVKGAVSKLSLFGFLRSVMNVTHREEDGKKDKHKGEEE